MFEDFREEFESGIGDLRDYCTSIFSRGVKVYRYDNLLGEQPEIKRVNKRVEAFKLDAEIKINASKLPDLHEKISCEIHSVKFSQELVKLHGGKIKRIDKREIAIHKFPIARKIRTWDATKRIVAMPQERTNRLKWQRERPKLNQGEMLLAWYGPIVDGAVLKLALNKQKGTLLIWYNHRSRQFKARGVFLFRRLGLGEKPQWRWL